jgi:lipopolysaccharide export system protein LptA
MSRLHRINLVSYHWFTLVLIMYAPIGFTATHAPEENIQVQANHMKFDMETGSSTYEGDVKINQGEIELNGDKVIIKRQHNEIQQINIDGQPARYIQDEDSEQKVHASSQHMRYFAKKNRLIMTIDARLEQPDHTIESQRIVYDTKNKIVLAGSNKQNKQGERVNITLTPNKNNTATPATTEKK